jgi:UDP-N-acetylglucosamine 2-epimerase (non-hydrolysing)
MILICYGTRPEYLKVLPIIQKLGSGDCLTFFTRQHDLKEENISYDFCSYKEGYDGFNRLDDIVANTIKSMSVCINFINRQRGKVLKAILVQGDTASAFACALAGLHNKVPVIHLEAGLRSFDSMNPYPEESYRKMISSLATVHFAPTELSKKNLKNENITENVFVVGNSILDNLTKNLKDLEYEKTILVTLHRRENHLIYEEWLKEINSLAKKYSDYNFFIFMHPNNELQDKIKSIKWKSNIIINEPVSHEEFISYLTKTSLVLTDSGGIQEEASFFNKRTIVLRKTTERPEGIKSNHLKICKSPKKLKSIFKSLIENKSYLISTDCPYGNGTTSEQVYTILKNLKFI